MNCGSSIPDNAFRQKLSPNILFRVIGRFLSPHILFSPPCPVPCLFPSLWNFTTIRDLTVASLTHLGLLCECGGLRNMQKAQSSGVEMSPSVSDSQRVNSPSIVLSVYKHDLGYPSFTVVYTFYILPRDCHCTSWSCEIHALAVSKNKHYYLCYIIFIIHVSSALYKYKIDLAMRMPVADREINCFHYYTKQCRRLRAGKIRLLWLSWVWRSRLIAYLIEGLSRKSKPKV